MLPKRTLIFLLLILLAGNRLAAQTTCTTLGQNPETAFPVCGTALFHQGIVPICGGNLMLSPCPDPSGVITNRNPFWYKFTCFSSGKLSFFITPDVLTEDYDWQLFDVTGRNPGDVFTDPSLFVACNWSGDVGITGASDVQGGVSLVECAGSGVNLFSMMPDLIAGHNYLLLVSHFSDTQFGYTLSFGGPGNTAVITDTVAPHLANASKASCDATRIMVKLNKRMKCSSLAVNGSDFTVNPPLATVTSATGIGCASGFDMDSILLTFNQPLPIGNYNLVMNRGSDNNTILDICDNGIPENEQIAFTILSNLPVPFDSLQHDHCLTDSFLIILADSIQCTSIAANGSDFSITGPYPVTIANAAPAYCLNGFTRQIIVRLNTAMIQPGNFRLVLQAGSDGNTLLSKCDTASVAGSFIPFVIKPKPFVDFSVPVSLCLPDALARFINRSTISDGTENLFQYAWDFGDPASIPNNTSSLKDPLHRYTRVGPFDVSLQVTSNAGCVHDTLIRFNNIHPQPISNFGFSKSPLCIGDVVTMTDSTNSMDGFTVEWYWDLGDGSTRNIPSFTYTYSNTRTYPVTLYSMNNHGCFSDTMTKTITVFPYPVVDAGPDRTVLAGGQLTIVPTVSGNGLQYLWTPSTYLDNPASPSPKCIAPQNDIRYTLTVTGEGGCKASDDMLVKVLKAPRIPNTFTPNNDGINDRWLIQYLEDYPNNRLQVFTRAGQLVYESRGYYTPWDGTCKGRKLPYDTYYYILEPGNGREPVSGYVTIIK